MLKPKAAAHPTYGGVLRAMRDAAGLTAQEVAGLVGVQRTYIHAVEADRREPSIDLARRICAAVGGSLAALDAARRPPEKT